MKNLQSLADPCLYVRTTNSGCVIIIAATDSDLMTEVKESLRKRFKMKDLGELKWFLGTEFRRNENEMQMKQTRFIQKILPKFKMSDCKPKPTPCILGFETTTNDDSKELTDPKLHRAIVGSYLRNDWNEARLMLCSC